MADRREPGQNIGRFNDLLNAGAAHLGRRLRLLVEEPAIGRPVLTPGCFAMVAPGIDMAQVLMVAKGIDWHHPVVLMSRASDEAQWSYARVCGRSEGEEAA